jgi:hypothetical protein
MQTGAKAYALLDDFGFGTSCQFSKGGLSEGSLGDAARNSVAKCEALCDADRDCVGYTFIGGMQCVRGSTKCWLFSSCDADQRVKSGCLGADEQPVYVTKEKSSANAAYQEVDALGWGTGCHDDQKIVNGATYNTAAECEAFCNEQSDCRAYTFVDNIMCGSGTTTNWCSLYDECIVPSKTGCSEPIYLGKIVAPGAQITPLFLTPTFSCLLGAFGLN